MNFFTFQFEILQILMITLLRQMNTDYHQESNEIMIMESSYECSSTKTNVNNNNNVQLVTNPLHNAFEFENPYASYTTWQNSANSA